MGGRHRLVADREVPDLQLVDVRVLGAGRGRLAQPVPAGRRERPVGEVGDDRAGRVGGQRHRVRVGDDVGLHPAGRRGEHPHLVRVGGALPRPRAADLPDAVAVPAHREPRRADQQVHRLRGRRPDGEPRRAVPPGDAEVAAGGAAVDVVEHAGDLHAGRVDQRARGVEGRHRDLAREELRDRGRRGQRERRVRRQVREVRGHADGRGRQVVDRRGPDHRTVLHGHPAVRRVVEPVARRRRRLPGEQSPPEPVRGPLGAQGPGQVVGDPVGRVVVGERDLPARRGQRDVGAARRPARPVVLVPRPVERDLVLVPAGRHVERAAEDAGRPGDRQEPGLDTRRLPVLRATQLGLERADERDLGRQWSVVGARRPGERDQDDERGDEDDTDTRSHETSKGDAPRIGVPRCPPVKRPGASSRAGGGPSRWSRSAPRCRR